MTVTNIQTYRHTGEQSFANAVAKQVEENRMCYLQGGHLREQLGFFDEKQWLEFANSWNNLTQDKFMKDNGTYRLRRFSEWTRFAHQEALEPIAPRPYVQPLYINPLNGAIERTFDPFEPQIAENAFFNNLMHWCLSLFEEREGPSDWEVQVFQNRIVSLPEETGLPTPEGAHRDGVTYILMMLIDRVHVEGGETTLYDEARNVLGTLTLRDAMDCVVANDERTLHGVTPIVPAPGCESGHRDMLIAMFTKLN